MRESRLTFLAVGSLNSDDVEASIKMGDGIQSSNELSFPVAACDAIYLRNLRLSAEVEPDAWSRYGKSQPVIINLQLHLDTSRSGISDDLQYSFSYGQMYKDVSSAIDGGRFDYVSLVTELIKAAWHWPGKSVDCRVMLPKALLRVEEGISLQFQMVKLAGEAWTLSTIDWSIKGLKTACIIGVNAHERLEKQTVNVEIHFHKERDALAELHPPQDIGPWRWRSLVAEVHKVYHPSFNLCGNSADQVDLQVIENSAFETLEGLAASIAKTCLAYMPVPDVEVIVEKPSALAHVEASGVKICRNRDHFTEFTLSDL